MYKEQYIYMYFISLIRVLKSVYTFILNKFGIGRRIMRNIRFNLILLQTYRGVMINHICNYRIAFLITSKKLTNIIFVHYKVCSCLIETSINTLFQLIHVIFHFNFLCTSITSEKNFFFLYLMSLTLASSNVYVIEGLWTL